MQKLIKDQVSSSISSDLKVLSVIIAISYATCNVVDVCQLVNRLAKVIQKCVSMDVSHSV